MDDFLGTNFYAPYFEVPPFEAYSYYDGYQTGSSMC